jgi:hypothetical protein
MDWGCSFARWSGWTVPSIEVKATSYWQSWRVVDEFGNPREFPRVPQPVSRISFRVAPTRDSASVRNVTPKPAYKADYYVFCFEHEKVLADWNPLDLSQWEFYYLDQSELVSLRRTTIPLSLLRAHFNERFGAPEGFTARQFQEHLQAVVTSPEAAR